MRARFVATFLAPAALACVLLAGCYSKPKQAPAPARQIDFDAPFAAMHEAELEESIPKLTCPDDGPPPPGVLSMREAAEALPDATPKIQLTFARAASRCRDVESAAIVYRLVPALLLKRLEPAEIERTYAFLRDDRERGLALLRTLLTSDRDGVGLSRAVPSELEAFRPERALAATCADLAGITPRFESQVELADRVLTRTGCAEERTQLLLRSLASTSRARSAACRKIEREKLRELADAVTAAAETDPGERVPSGHDPFPGAPAASGDGLFGAIFAGLLSPLTSVGNEPGDPGVLTHPGKWTCEIAAKNLAKAR